MLRNQRFALAAAWLGSIGCGDDDGGRSTPAPSSAANSCAKGCARASAAKCPNQPTTCQQQCEAQVASTPAGCIGNVNAYASCLNGAVFSCDADGLAEALGCSAQLSAWQACLGGTQRDASTPDASPPADARVTDTGTADTGTSDATAPDASAPDASAPDASVFTCAPEVGDQACDSCLKSECCAEITACDLNCISLTACANACPDNDEGSCALACQQQYPNGIPGLTDVSDCLDFFCTAPCYGD